MMSAETVITSIAGDMMGGHNPVSHFELGNTRSHLDHLSRYLMPQHKRRLLQAIPFQNVTSADSAGFHSHQQLARPDARHRHFFYSDVVVTVIHSYAHGHSFSSISKYYV
jgi:hypothetical protein